MNRLFTLRLLLPCFLSSFIAVSSCNKTENQFIPKEASYELTYDEQTAMRNFSIALSKVMCSSKDIRDFLKENALKQVDNDYDVFYPFIKDTKINPTYTFREAIVKEFSSETEMDKIEKFLPTLTIYVPDVTWFDPKGFCAENWDTSDSKCAVTFQGKNKICEELFSNGFSLGKIEHGTIPGGNTIIVKNNERITAETITKSAEPQYHFIDDIYNGRNRTPETKDNRHSGDYSAYWIGGQAAKDSSDIIPASILNKINPDIIQSYNLCNNYKDACQNDYIYYGMKSPKDSGELRNDVRAKIFRFKISPNSFDAIFDDSYGNKPDKKFSNIYETDDNGGSRNEPCIDELYSLLWAEGALEINVKVYIGDKKNEASLFKEYYYDIKAKDLFTINKGSILRERWGSTMFKWYITWRYSIPYRDKRTFSAKWYYPKDNYYLPNWNLAKNSGYTIIVCEKDSGTKVTKTFGVMTKRANNITTKLGGGFSFGKKNKVDIKAEIGWTFYDEESNTKQVSISWNETDDLLFHDVISYNDKYIKNKVLNYSYFVYPYGGSRFAFTILPYTY